MPQSAYRLTKDRFDIMDDKTFPTAAIGFSWEEIGNGGRCQGVPSFRNNDGITIEIPFGQILADRFAFVVSEDKPPEADFLYMFTQNGRWAVAQNASSRGVVQSIPGGINQTIQASQLLVSKSKFDPTAPVKKMDVKLSGLREWLGLSPIKSIASPESRAEDRFLVRYDESQDRTLLDNNALKITVYHTLGRSGTLVEGVRIAHDCVLRVEFKNKTSLEEAENVAIKLSSFFSCANFFDAEITELEVFFEGAEDAVECLIPLVRGIKPTTRQLRSIPLPYAKIKGDVAAALDFWSNDKKSVEPRNLTVSLLFRNHPTALDLNFIAAAQTLEALTKLGADQNALPKETYKEYRSAVLSSIEDPEIKAWARERINGNQKGQKRLLAEFASDNSELFDWFIGDVDLFIKRHIATRNRITHRMPSKNRDALSGELLYWHTRCVLLISYMFMLSLSGINPKTAISGFEERGIDNHAIAKIKEMYGA